jgi:hypothetical protein
MAITTKEELAKEAWKRVLPALVEAEIAFAFVTPADDVVIDPHSVRVTRNEVWDALHVSDQFVLKAEHAEGLTDYLMFKEVEETAITVIEHRGEIRLRLSYVDDEPREG